MKKIRKPLASVTLTLIVAMLSCDIPTAIIAPATSIPGIVDTKAAMTWSFGYFGPVETHQNFHLVYLLKPQIFVN